MSTWLTNFDYKSVIRPNVESMVTDADSNNRNAAEAYAIQEVKGYLSYGYNVPAIFSQKVYDHVLTDTYKQGDWVVDANGIWYYALQAVPASTALTETAYWLVDFQTTPYTHSATSAYSKGASVEGPNLEQYLVIAGTTGAELTDTATFALKRNDLLVMIVVDISLYHLHARIHAKQIPEWRQLRYDDAIAKLKEIRKGNMNPGLPVLASTAAAIGEISIYSNTKRNNSWDYGTGYDPATQS